jgi:hypothetical protein
MFSFHTFKITFNNNFENIIIPLGCLAGPGPPPRPAATLFPLYDFSGLHVDDVDTD